MPGPTLGVKTIVTVAYSSAVITVKRQNEAKSLCTELAFKLHPIY